MTPFQDNNNTKTYNIFESINQLNRKKKKEKNE